MLTALYLYSFYPYLNVHFHIARIQNWSYKENIPEKKKNFMWLGFVTGKEF